MINISTSKQLDIILPNTNKALSHVLKNATTQELEIISKGKDLKSIMNTILRQSGNSSSSNKELLQLVKNNPTLKNLGDVSNTIKDLLGAIKSDKNPLPIEKVLKNFLIDIKDIKNSELKQKIENSGVFLEAKLKDVKNPQLELKNTLQALVKELQTSTTPSTQNSVKQAVAILNSELLKSTSSSTPIQDIKEKPKLLIQLSSALESLVSKLNTTLKRADIIHSPALAKVLEKLEHQIEPKMLTSENFKLSSIKDSLEQLSLHMSKSLSFESKGILGALEKIFQSVKAIEQTATTPKASLEQLLGKNVPSDISKLTDSIKSIIQKADPIFSKETSLILNKLEALSMPQQLNAQSSVKEILSNDLKALLLQASDDIVKSSHPNQSELLKHIDKLSLQIDHYQLLSHLSNASSLYLPFSWEQLQEGHIDIKKDKDDKFYCDIDLKLKEYGELNLKLAIYDDNQLNIRVYSDNTELKEMLKDNLPSLRSALIENQITPREIRLFNLVKEDASSPYKDESTKIDMGFEVKV